MRILITGAAGFIGHHVAHTTQAAGHDVLGLVRDASRTQKFALCQGTLAEAPWPAILKFKPEACLHAAWYVKPGAYWQAPENEVCRQQSRTFLRKLWSETGCHVTALGTCAEYAPSPSPLSEQSSPLRPESAYARAKHRLYEELQTLAAEQNYAFAWARIFYPFGPGEPGEKITSAWLTAALKGETVRVGQPASIKDFIAIEDVASILLGLLTTRATGPVNVASGTGTPIESLARTIVAMIGKGKIEVRPSETPDPLTPMVGSVQRLREWLPHFRPTRLERGLETLRASLAV